MLLAELRHLFRRVRILVLLVVLFLLPVLLTVAIRVNGGPGGGQGPAFLDRVSDNGLFAAFAGLTVALPFFLPLTVAIVAGDTIAGEASLGTLRYVLTRPSGRTRLLGVKAISVVVFCLAAAIVVVAGGLIAGAIFFPVGSLVGISGTTFSTADGVARALLAGVLVAASLLGLGAIGLFASTLTDVPVGAMAVTVGLGVLSTVLDAVPQVAFLHPWLLTHDWFTFGDILRSPVSWHGIVRDLLLQAGYIVVFASAAWARFTSRDVLV